MSGKMMIWLTRHQNQMMMVAVPFLICGFILKEKAEFYLVVTVLCGIPILVRALSALKYRLISIELLVTIAMIGALFLQEYHECAMVSFLFQIGAYLEGRSMRKTRSAVESLVRNAPAMAVRVRNTGTEEIDVDEVEINDILLVREGCRVPVDGTVTEGQGWVNESSVTGESEPSEKNSGSYVYAGTILENGLFRMKADRVGEDTTYARIVSLVEDAEDSKSHVERFIDRFARYYTPSVILISIVTYLCTQRIDTAVTVLVLACPGALVIGAPIAGTCGIGRGAADGILFKGSDVMHRFARSDRFLFDKTGTLTEGRMQVREWKCYSDNADEVIALAAELEKSSTHPIGKAVIGFAEEKKAVYIGKPFDTEVISGKGMQTGKFLLGSLSFMKEKNVVFTDEMTKDIEEIQNHGNTLVLMAEDKKPVLSLGISDCKRKGAAEALGCLKKLSHAKYTILSGDHEKAVRQIAEELHISQYEGGMLPQDKYAYVQKLQSEGHNVCFVGDGINDSPSIVKADTGIAMGGGTDVAIECSDVVILGNDPEKLPQAYEIAGKTVKVTYENIVIAVGTVFLLIAGLLAGWIHMGTGMFIHEMSILAVIINGMRLQKGRKK